MNFHLNTDRDYKVWVLMTQAQIAIIRARGRELRRYGISPREAATLLYIQAIGDKATPAEISRWIFREHHTVTAILRRMEKKGLIKKVKDVDRKNSWRVGLTEKGEKAYRQSVKMESIHAIISCLSNNERQQLESHSRKLRDQALRLSVSESIPPFP